MNSTANLPADAAGGGDHRWRYTGISRWRTAATLRGTVWKRWLAGNSLGKVWDLLKHLWIPVVVVGTAGTAGHIRVMRGNLLDELKKQYVITARAKGVTERVLLFKYPVKLAINPMVSTVGWLLPELISGATITSVVLGLPTTGPLLLRALLNQDMYLACSFLMLLAILTVVGTLVSDILLAWVDPRIRY